MDRDELPQEQLPVMLPQMMSQNGKLSHSVG